MERADINLFLSKFLGQTDFFSTGMVSMSKLSGAPILPLFCIKEESGKTTLIIKRPINMESVTDRKSGLESCVSIYANILETYIKLYPEQYRNWHLVGMAPDVVS